MMIACKSESKTPPFEAVRSGSVSGLSIAERLDQYQSLRLSYDISTLSDSEQQIIVRLIAVSQLMDTVFWKQSMGPPDSLMRHITNDSLRRLIEINYGPYDRLNGNEPFVTGIPEKPAGASFYPTDMSREEFIASGLLQKTDMFTLLLRQENGRLTTQYYHEAFAHEHQRAAALLKEAAGFAQSDGFREYLERRAGDFLGGDYLTSNYIWLETHDNRIEFIAGPIESYEDKLFGYKAAHQALLLIKDTSMSRQLERYAAFLPDLQAQLPVDESYRPVLSFDKNAEINAYDAIYAGGLFNAGSKTMAINLPLAMQRLPGLAARRLLIKNIIRAKFDDILQPINQILIAEDQQAQVTYEAFFSNTLFHEIAQDLGVQDIRGGNGSVHGALREYASIIDEGKADILGMYMAGILIDRGEITHTTLEEMYTTYLASMFRSMRFGRSDDHGKANMLAFYHFLKEGAIERQAVTGRYRTQVDRMRAAVKSLSQKYLTLQGDGNYNAVVRWVEEEARITPELRADIDRLQIAGVPVDLIFEQGPEVLGVK